MGKIAFYLSLFALVLSAIPFVGVFALFPAGFALFMGIFDLMNKAHMYDKSIKKYPKMAILFSLLAIAMVFVWLLFAMQQQ